MPKIEANQIAFEGEGRAEVFSFCPENVDKEKLGNLFFVGNISYYLSRNDTNYYMLNSLAAILKKEYYISPHLQPHQALEGALKKVNSFLITNVKSKRDLLELAVIMLWESNVMFSTLGNTEVLLVRQGRIFRLAKSGGKKTQIFQNLTKGKVKTHDRIIVGTSELTHWLTNSSFTSRLLKRPWARLIHYLSQERVEERRTNTFAMLQVCVSHPSYATPLTEEPLNEEPIESFPDRPRSSSHQLRLPILTEKPKRYAPLSRAKAIASSLWNHLTFLKKGGEWIRSFLLMRSSLLRKWDGRTISGFSIGRIKKVAIAMSILLVIFFGARYTSKPIEPILPDQGELIQHQGAIVVFNQLSPPLEPQEALFVGERLFFTAQNTLYELPLDATIPNSLLTIKQEVKGLINVNDDTLALIIKDSTNNWEVLFYALSKQSIKREALSWPLEADIIGEIKEYAGNIYLLELFERQIIKYSLANLQKPTRWITQNAKERIQNPLSFAVDGSIYLLETPTTLFEMRSGSIERSIPLPFGVEATRVITDVTMPTLYLINEDEGMLILIDKASGALTHSFRDPRLKELRAIRIDEQGGFAQIATTKGVYRISLTQE